MSQDLFTVRERALLLHRNPDPQEIDGLKIALERMAVAPARDGSAAADGLLDMSELHGVSSTMVGLTVAAHLLFAEAGARLRVRLNPKLLKLFELTMLTDTLSLEMAGEEEKGPAGPANPKA
jgi:hypothetical protein